MTTTKTSIASASDVVSSRRKKCTGCGIFMIISPAKTFDLSPWDKSIYNDSSIGTQPDCCIEKTIKVAQAMKRMSKVELTKALKLSSSLANIAHEYWSNFDVEKQHNTSNNNNNTSKPCIFMYSGPAYQGISIHDCNGGTGTGISTTILQYMQNHLRILDAVYGILRPLDIIQPYRLEMDTKNIDPPTISKLSTFWSKDITNRLILDLKKQSRPKTDNNDDSNKNELPILLNLASDEYVAAIDIPQIQQHCQYIKIIFYEDNKIVSVHAKRARGLMVRYIAETNATTLNDVKQFNVEGYEYIRDDDDDDEKSDDAITQLVFNRCKNYSKDTTVSKTKNATSKKNTLSSPTSPTNTTTTGTNDKRAKKQKQKR